MSMLDSIVTAHPLTGAQRLVTPDLLREVYLAPNVPAADIGAAVATVDSPWAASYQNAPRETISAVSAALRNLMLATRRLDPAEVDPTKLEPRSRLRRHVEALLQVWQAIGDALPLELQVLRYVICSDRDSALEALPIVDTGKLRFASAAEMELHSVLVRQHGLVGAEPQRIWQERQTNIYKEAKSVCSLGHAQKHLLNLVGEPIAPDGTLSVWGVRDVAEESELAAAISQRLIDRGATPHEIAVLLPNDPSYQQHLGRAFEAAGLPLSGLPISAPRRDIATETLLHFMLALNMPAPAMVLASLYVSPLMPWSTEIGAALAREVMKGRYEPAFTKSFKGKAHRLFQVLRDARSRDGARISAQLDRLAQCLSEDEAYRDEVLSLRGQLPNLKDRLATMNTPDWELLLEELNPTAPTTLAAERFVEGVSVFSETALPWRGAKHLIVLGAVAGRYPSASSPSPLFLDSELQKLSEQTGLCLPGRSDQLVEGLELFRRQFSVASESCTFIYPMRGLDGSRQTTSTALSLIARTTRDMSKLQLQAIEEPEALICDIRAAPQEEWPCLARKVELTEQNIARQLPESGEIRLNRNLFMSRIDEDGVPRRQSPSRFEKLLISPLAWTLSEFGVEEVIWAPETYDHILAGTLAHEVMEHLFPKCDSLPEEADITAKAGGMLDQAIRKHAPFLNNPLWKVERQGLERDIIRAAKSWRASLAAIGARVLDNEIVLMGETHGVNLLGRADSLLSLPDGRLLIIDHKKSGSTKRRERMEAGWDLQLGLYRAMLLKPALKEGVLNEMLKDKPGIGVAYHLINDGGILVNGIELSGDGFEFIDTDISLEAIPKLQERIADVSIGLVRLNSADDGLFFEKTAKLTPYALKESTLVAAFLIPSVAEEASAND